MKRLQREYIRVTYTPKPQSIHWRRDLHEDLLRRLFKEAHKTEFIADLSYLPDIELLQSINGLLIKLGVQTYSQEDLERPLSLKN